LKLNYLAVFQLLVGVSFKNITFPNKSKLYFLFSNKNLNIINFETNKSRLNIQNSCFEIKRSR